MAAGPGRFGSGRGGRDVTGRLRIPLVLAAIVLVVAAPSGASNDATGVNVTPSEVGIGLFYRGATLHVSGAIPAGHQAAVLCVGKESTIEARRKGRVWGLLWMNKGDITFEHVPSVYLLATSAPLAELAPPATLAALGLGFDALEEAVFADGGPKDAEARFGELVRLKERDGMFAVRQGSVRLEPQQGGALTARAALFLPARAAAGAYEIRLYSFRHGAGRLDGRAAATLRPAGVARFVTAMATGRGLLYGVVSALIAMAAGLLAGMVFGLGRRRGH